MATTATPPANTFALIIGAGPIGLYASIALARHGYRSVIVERKPVRSMVQPKAHAINSRSLEILKQTGFSIPALRKLGADPSDADLVRFEESLAGIEFGNLQYERQDEAVKEFTPEPLANIPQPKLEEYLQEHALKTGLVTIRYGWQWQFCSQEAEGSGVIRSIVVDRATGATVHVNSTYLFACDGAHSRARSVFGISINVPKSAYPTSARYISVTVAADLRKYRSGMLHVILQGKELQVLIAYDRASSWVLMFGIAHDDPVEKFNEEYCPPIMDKARESLQAIGDKVDYEVVNICAWEAALHISDFYRSRAFPNAFLLGDAAHTFPNAGGLGINTGLADVHNLVWKIHAVEQRWTVAPDTLLDSYTAERRPVAEVSCGISDHNQFRITKICETVSSTMSNPKIDWQDPEKRKALQGTISAQWSFSDHLNLHLGYIYGQHDLGFAPQGEEQIPANSQFYKPLCVPGARLPHGWVTRAGTTISTLDLVDWSAFTIFASPNQKGVPTVIEGPNKVPLVYWQLERDFSDMDGHWASIVGLTSDQSFLLVRPDHHILGFAATPEEVNEIIIKSL